MKRKSTRKRSNAPLRSRKPSGLKLEELSISEYIERCLPILGLSEWKVKYESDETCSEGAEADISRAEQGKQAYLRLSNEFWRFEPIYQRGVICHELIHLHLASIDDLVGNLEQIIGVSAMKLLQLSYTDYSEHLVEALRVLLEKSLPICKLVP